MKTQQQKQKTKKQTELRLKWQTGDYARLAEFHFYLPYQLLLLCKLTSITPEKLLLDFMDALDHGSWKREEVSEKARQLLTDYFIERGYGKDFYSEEERTTMFKEMDSVGMLWPGDAKMKFIDLHTKWRDKYQNYRFKKWFRKIRRKS
jgi:hypothetical protein